MKIYVWRHSKKFSSWSMFDEPHVYGDGYMEASVAVLAENEEEALAIIAKRKGWNVDELSRLKPLVFPTDQSVFIMENVN